MMNRQLQSNKIQDLTILGLLIALVAVSTMLIKIPVVSTEGYIHLGDSMIFLASIMFGKKKGAIAGGLGSAMADLLLGYTHWILPTLIIKGLMGYGIGAISDQENDNIINFRNSGALVFGASWMVFGYFIAGGIMKGSFVVSATSIPANLVQGFVGALLFIPIGIALKKTKYFKQYVLK
ncbi:ECF transporter S component [Alkaliphilus sp. MSJ-5]|uniref:ECF transporter S component n=1 Tax=Alkaliphilus flagellatus TaxID=2841507 RepID=A0ABS6FYB7_9FIRM|nr:ECF transporter S component [Alkaliphilus flagellatus]MBU5675233.1 ECF transporter S component [Alkaliphilus flagellatus]